MSDQLNKFIKRRYIRSEGPCLARELANNKIKTKAIIANKNINTAKIIGKLILSTNYYKFDYYSSTSGV